MPGTLTGCCCCDVLVDVRYRMDPHTSMGSTFFTRPTSADCLDRTTYDVYQFQTWARLLDRAAPGSYTYWTVFAMEWFTNLQNQIYVYWYGQVRWLVDGVEVLRYKARDTEVKARIPDGLNLAGQPGADVRLEIELWYRRWTPRPCGLSPCPAPTGGENVFGFFASKGNTNPAYQGGWGSGPVTDPWRLGMWGAAAVIPANMPVGCCSFPEGAGSAYVDWCGLPTYPCFEGGGGGVMHVGVILRVCWQYLPTTEQLTVEAALTFTHFPRCHSDSEPEPPCPPCDPWCQASLGGDIMAWTGRATFAVLNTCTALSNRMRNMTLPAVDSTVNFGITAPGCTGSLDLRGVRIA